MASKKTQLGGFFMCPDCGKKNEYSMTIPGDIIAPIVRYVTCLRYLDGCGVMYRFEITNSGHVERATA